MKILIATAVLFLASLITAQTKDCPPEEVIINGKCGKCPAGTTYDEYGQSCFDCGPNFFKAEEGNEPCSQCPPGSFAGRRSTKCVECPNGTVLLKKGKCGTCPKGTYYDSYETRCRKCSPGTFQPERNIRESCFSCSGDTNSLKGETKCTKCPRGEAIMKDGTCGSCPPGTYYNSYRVVCQKCERNSFQPYENVRDSCFQCSGDSNSDKGATVCTKCPQGKVLMKDGNCRKCPPGTGYEGYRLKCTRCPFNTYSKGKGIDQFCTECPNKYYTNRGASTASACFECPQGEALIAHNKNKGRCGKCRSGYYYDRYSATCFDCGEDTVSLGGDSPECRYCEGDTKPNEDRTACVHE